MVKVCKLGGGEEQVKCGGGCIDIVFLLQVPAVVYGSRSTCLEEFKHRRQRLTVGFGLLQ